MILSVLLIGTFFGCSRVDINQSNQKRISIAEQYGLAYAPLQIMKEMKLLEKNMPGLEVDWKQLGNTAAIREAMVAGEVDAGFMAIPPFLIGWDKGMKWKIATGLSVTPTALVTNDPSIKSIKDLTSKDRIALPQPGSIQHILLSMASLKEFGDASKLDGQLVTLAHPDGMNALMAKTEISAHFTSPPYLYYELEQGMHEILSGSEIMGSKYSFIVGVTTNTLHNQNKELYDVFIKSVEEAVVFIQNNPKEAAAILSDSYEIPEDQFLKYLTWEGTEYTTEVYGLQKFSEYMKANGNINEIPSPMGEVLWEDVKYEN